MNAEDVATFERCIAVGGVALFPADTVYGLATEPDTREGVERLYAIKGRPPRQPAAVMFFQLELALAALPELGPRTRAAARAPAARRPDAAAAEPGAALPARLRAGAGDARPARARADRRARAAGRRALAGAPVERQPVRRHRRAPARRRRRAASGARVDMQLDGGELPGTPSTVVDLTSYERDGSHTVLRVGAVAARAGGRTAALIHPYVCPSWRLAALPRWERRCS